MSSSLPSRRETPSAPFGRPSCLPEALARARPSRVRSEIRSRSTSANSAQSVGRTVVWMSRVPSTRMCSVSATRKEGDVGRGEGVEDGDDLPQRPTEPGEFADDHPGAALEDVQQRVEPAALVGSLSRGGRLDERVDADVVVACVLEDGEALAAHVLLGGRDPQRGDGFHGLSMECGVGYFSGQIRTMECVTFPATTLFSQNGRVCLTAPCRAPIPTSLAPV